MKLPFRTTAILPLIIALCVPAVTSQAAVVAQYGFPASYDGTGTTFTDLSSPANNGTSRAQAADDLSTNVPAGAASGTRSLDLSKTNFQTNTSGLLTVTNINDAGGFSFELWYNQNNTSFTTYQQLIGHGGNADMYLWDDGSIRFRGSSTGGNAALFAQTPASVIGASGWHHIVLEYTPTSLSDGTLTGTVAISVDGVAQTITSASQTVTNAVMNTPIGFGVRGGGTANNRALGLMYDPQVALIPEPRAAALLLLGALALLRRRR